MRQNERMKCSHQLHSTSKDSLKKERKSSSINAYRGSGRILSEVWPLWTLVVDDNEAEPQHCRYRRKSSVIARGMLILPAMFTFCLPVILLVAKSLFPGLIQTSIPRWKLDWTIGPWILDHILNHLQHQQQHPVNHTSNNNIDRSNFAICRTMPKQFPQTV